MFCPDCGKESSDDIRVCPGCGYSLERLRKRLEDEKLSGLGWAEKIIKPMPRTSDKSTEELNAVKSFVSIPKDESDNVDKENNCARCGLKPGVSTSCQHCGDLQPSSSENDPFLLLVLSRYFRFILSPSRYALTLPYPANGGIMQPCLWTGVIAAVYILTLPFANPGFSNGENTINFAGLALIGMTVYVLFVPALVYVSSGFVHLVAVLLGGVSLFKRTLRAFASGMIVLGLYGIMKNLFLLILFILILRLGRIGVLPVTPEYVISTIGDNWRLPMAFVLIFAGVYFAFLMGGLHRLNWWKTLVLTVLTYMTVLWWIWLLSMVLIPIWIIGRIS